MNILPETGIANLTKSSHLMDHSTIANGTCTLDSARLQTTFTQFLEAFPALVAKEKRLNEADVPQTDGYTDIEGEQDLRTQEVESDSSKSDAPPLINMEENQLSNLNEDQIFGFFEPKSKSHEDANQPRPLNLNFGSTISPNEASKTPDSSSLSQHSRGDSKVVALQFPLSDIQNLLHSHTKENLAPLNQSTIALRNQLQHEPKTTDFKSPFNATPADTRSTIPSPNSGHLEVSQRPNEDPSKINLIPRQNLEASEPNKKLDTMPSLEPNSPPVQLPQLSKKQYDEPLKPRPTLMGEERNQEARNVLHLPVSGDVKLQKLPYPIGNLTSPDKLAIGSHWDPIEPQIETQLSRAFSERAETNWPISQVQQASAASKTDLAPTPQNRIVTANATQISDAAIKLQETGGKVDVSLTPEDLGRLTIKLDQLVTGTQITFSAERAETQELMRRHIETLQSHMKSLGFDNLSFEFKEEQQKQEADRSPTRRNDEVTDVGEAFVSPTEIKQLNIAQSGLDIRI